MLLETIRADRAITFEKLSQLVALRSVHAELGSGDGDSSAASYAAAARWVFDEFAALGFDCTMFDCADGSQAIYGFKPARIPASSPESAPTVLLYSHFDVVGPGEESGWAHPPFQLTRVPGSERWSGRGAADCKGAVVMHLTALRALCKLEEELGAPSCNIKVIVEGSEENGGRGLRELVREQPDLLEADTIFIADTGNVAVGVPTLVTMLRGSAQIRVRLDTLASPAHSGKFGGGAPDAVAALIRILDSLHDTAGNTVIDGVDCTAQWAGEPYDPERFRADAGLLDGVELLGSDSADQVWARPAITFTGFSSTPVEQAVNAIPPHAEAQLNLRVPPGLGMNTREVAQKVIEHLEARVPWGAHFSAEILSASQFFTADTDSKALSLLKEALSNSYGRDTALVGTGGSIPLTVELAEAYPRATIALFGVQDAGADIHSTQESVDPAEIEHIAAAEAEFLLRCGR